MMKPPTKAAVIELVTELRALAPKRPLSYGESRKVARLQAARVRTWTGAEDQPDINLAWLVNQDAYPVHFVPSYRLGEESGLTTNVVDGKVQMFINEQEMPERQRFSLAHEWKHVIDFDDAELLHGGLGSGDEQRKRDQIEWVCNEFAAYLLMPTRLVKTVWRNLKDIDATALHFNVSASAMQIRLTKLGLINRPSRVKHAVYFRRSGFIHVPHLALDPCAA